MSPEPSKVDATEESDIGPSGIDKGKGIAEVAEADTQTQELSEEEDFP